MTNNIELNGKIVLVTGAAGFIGSNPSTQLLNTVDFLKITDSR